MKKAPGNVIFSVRTYGVFQHITDLGFPEIVIRRRNVDKVEHGDSIFVSDSNVTNMFLNS